MNVGRITTAEAAAIINASPQFVRVAMQQEKLPIGTAIKMSTVWTYNIWTNNNHLFTVLFWI